MTSISALDKLAYFSAPSEAFTHVSGLSYACKVCREPALHRCQTCKIEHYCGAEHQRQDWQTHKRFCTAVQSSEQLVQQKIGFSVDDIMTYLQGTGLTPLMKYLQTNIRTLLDGISIDKLLEYRPAALITLAEGLVDFFTRRNLSFAKFRKLFSAFYESIKALLSGTVTAEEEEVRIKTSELDKALEQAEKSARRDADSPILTEVYDYIAKWLVEPLKKFIAKIDALLGDSTNIIAQLCEAVTNTKVEESEEFFVREPEPPLQIDDSISEIYTDDDDDDAAADEHIGADSSRSRQRRREAQKRRSEVAAAQKKRLDEERVRDENARARRAAARTTLQNFRIEATRVLWFAGNLPTLMKLIKEKVEHDFVVALENIYKTYSASLERFARKIIDLAADGYVRVERLFEALMNKVPIVSPTSSLLYLMNLTRRGIAGVQRVLNFLIGLSQYRLSSLVQSLLGWVGKSAMRVGASVLGVFFPNILGSNSYSTDFMEKFKGASIAEAKVTYENAKKLLTILSPQAKQTVFYALISDEIETLEKSFKEILDIKVQADTNVQTNLKAPLRDRLSEILSAYNDYFKIIAEVSVMHPGGMSKADFLDNVPRDYEYDFLNASERMMMISSGYTTAMIGRHVELFEKMGLSALIIATYISEVIIEPYERRRNEYFAKNPAQGVAAVIVESITTDIDRQSMIDRAKQELAHEKIIEEGAQSILQQIGANEENVDTGSDDTIETIAGKPVYNMDPQNYPPIKDLALGDLDIALDTLLDPNASKTMRLYKNLVVVTTREAKKYTFRGGESSFFYVTKSQLYKGPYSSDISRMTPAELKAIEQIKKNHTLITKKSEEWANRTKNSTWTGWIVFASLFTIAAGVMWWYVSAKTHNTTALQTIGGGTGRPVKNVDMAAQAAVGVEIMNDTYTAIVKMENDTKLRAARNEYEQTMATAAKKHGFDEMNQKYISPSELGKKFLKFKPGEPQQLLGSATSTTPQQLLGSEAPTTPQQLPSDQPAFEMQKLRPADQPAFEVQERPSKPQFEAFSVPLPKQFESPTDYENEVKEYFKIIDTLVTTSNIDRGFVSAVMSVDDRADFPLTKFIGHFTDPDAWSVLTYTEKITRLLQAYNAQIDKIKIDEQAKTAAAYFKEKKEAMRVFASKMELPATIQANSIQSEVFNLYKKALSTGTPFEYEKLKRAVKFTPGDTLDKSNDYYIATDVNMQLRQHHAGAIFSDSGQYLMEKLFTPELTRKISDYDIANRIGNKMVDAQVKTAVSAIFTKMKQGLSENDAEAIKKAIKDNTYSWYNPFQFSWPWSTPDELFSEKSLGRLDPSKTESMPLFVAEEQLPHFKRTKIIVDELSPGQSTIRDAKHKAEIQKVIDSNINLLEKQITEKKNQAERTYKLAAETVDERLIRSLDIGQIRFLNTQLQSTDYLDKLSGVQKGHVPWVTNRLDELQKRTTATSDETVATIFGDLIFQHAKVYCSDIFGSSSAQAKWTLFWQELFIWMSWLPGVSSLNSLIYSGPGYTLKQQMVYDAGREEAARQAANRTSMENMVGPLGRAISWATDKALSLNPFNWFINLANSIGEGLSTVFGVIGMASGFYVTYLFIQVGVTFVDALIQTYLDYVNLNYLKGQVAAHDDTVVQVFPDGAKDLLEKGVSRAFKKWGWNVIVTVFQMLSPFVSTGVWIGKWIFIIGKAMFMGGPTALAIADFGDKMNAFTGRILRGQ